MTVRLEIELSDEQLEAAAARAAEILAVRLVGALRPDVGSAAKLEPSGQLGGAAAGGLELADARRRERVWRSFYQCHGRRRTGPPTIRGSRCCNPAGATWAMDCGVSQWGHPWCQHHEPEGWRDPSAAVVLALPKAAA